MVDDIIYVKCIFFFKLKLFISWVSKLKIINRLGLYRENSIISIDHPNLKQYKIRSFRFHYFGIQKPNRMAFTTTIRGWKGNILHPSCIATSIYKSMHFYSTKNLVEYAVFETQRNTPCITPALLFILDHRYTVTSYNR